MLHFFDDPFEYEDLGYDPYYDARIGPPMPIEMLMQRFGRDRIRVNTISDEERERLRVREDREWEETWEQWEQYKKAWKRRV